MTRTRLTTLAAGVVAAIVLVGCSTAEEEPEREVRTEHSSLPAAQVDELLLPFAFQELPTYTLPYDAPPQEMDGVLFGLQEIDGVLEFTAVEGDGTVLWSTQRPASCSGFTLSRAGEIPIAVLTDVESTSDSLAQVSASAYDLRTGDQVWGPVAVPGPWHGPGTVFAEAAPASAMGEVGERVALDPKTGNPLELTGEVIGEYSGTLLTTDSGSLHASGASSWEIPVSELAEGRSGEVAAVAGVHPPPGYALVAADRVLPGALIRLADGHVLTTAALSATWDPAAEIIVVNEPGTLAGYSEEGPVWNRGIEEDLKVAAAGGVLMYLRSDSAVQVINTVTGDDAVGYAPEATGYAVPELITAEGAAVFSMDSLILVGTHTAEGP